MPELDDFTRGYLTAALWTNDPNPGQGEYVPDFSRVTKRARELAIADCRQFQEEHRAELETYYRDRCPMPGYTPEECAGHDFLLTRDRHGVGFVDREEVSEEARNQLQAGAYHKGECTLTWFRNKLTTW